MSHSTAKMDIRVLLFEDNKLFRDAVQTILNGTLGYLCCGAYSNCDRLSEIITMTNPDVVLMDIEMPGTNGIEATRIIQNQFPSVKVLIQTVFEENEKIFNAMCAGASGYILKNDPMSRYLEAITEVYNGGAPMNMDVAKKILGFFSNKNVLLIAPSHENYRLTNREKELLSMMIEGENYKTIAENSFISYDTVRTHVRNIYQKLHVTSRNEAVMKAIQQRLV